jgi:spore coat protein U-like protein
MCTRARCLSLAVAAAALIATPATHAVTTCVGSNAAISLGTYLGDDSMPVDSMGSFTLTCTRDGGAPAVAVTMGIGASASTGGISRRGMRRSGGTDVLVYNIYRDAARVSVWGQTAGVDTVTQSVNVPNKGIASVTFTMFGRIEPLQNVRVGTYTDSLVISIVY